MVYKSETEAQSALKTPRSALPIDCANAEQTGSPLFRGLTFQDVSPYVSRSINLR
jgi:hypothetical protein